MKFSSALFFVTATVLALPQREPWIVNCELQCNYNLDISPALQTAKEPCFNACISTSHPPGSSARQSRQ